MSLPGRAARSRVCRAIGLVLALALGACAADGPPPKQPAPAASRDELQGKALDRIYTQAMRELAPGPPEADVGSAVRLLQLAATRGHAPSQFALARLYAKGWGVPADRAVAVRWLRAAAEQGYAPAQAQLAYAWLGGLGGLAADPAQALQWFRLAAGQGDLEAQFMVGRLQELGQGTPADPAAAALAYRTAAKRGYAPAQRQLGLLYLAGLGVPQDEAQALGWLLTAAQADDAEAAYRAGLLRESGETLGPDPVAAERLLGRAADQGHVPAQAALARLLAGGDAADRVQAALWLEIALRLSPPGPDRQALAQSRDALVASLPRSEVARLRTLAAVWEPRQPTTERGVDGSRSPWL